MKIKETGFVLFFWGIIGVIIDPEENRIEIKKY